MNEHTTTTTDRQGSQRRNIVVRWRHRATPAQITVDILSAEQGVEERDIARLITDYAAGERGSGASPGPLIDGERIVGHRGRDQFLLNLSSILRFQTHHGDVVAVAMMNEGARGARVQEFRVRVPLMELEQCLPRGFVRISHSEISHLAGVHHFSNDPRGALIVYYRDGARSVVARRRVATLKAALNL